MRHLELPLLVACLAGCAAAPSRRTAYELPGEAPPPPAGEVVAQDSFGSLRPSESTSVRPDWNVGQSLHQGFLGVTQYTTIDRNGGGTPSVDGDEGNLDTIPIIGGGAQYKMGGEKVDYGLEGLFSFGGRANASAFAAGGGGAAVAVDVDLLVFDFYGGPFVSTFLGDNVRLYAGAGPLLEWAEYDQSDSVGHESGSGFGYGGYARTGIEFVMPSRTLVGFGVRWSNTTVDLGGGLGDLDMEGFQLLFTVSRGI